jgi:hypothetical protein
MHPAIETRHESVRGCGYRRNGLYLVADGASAPCGKLPIPLTVCPCCGNGIRATRGWTWVDAGRLSATAICQSLRDCHPSCPLANPIGRAGLIWVGSVFYPKPRHFMEEAGRLGISRRISRVPRGFVLGETWVMLAHRQAIVKGCRILDDDCPECHGTGIIRTPGIFSAFKPSRIEYVVRGDETDEEIEEKIAAGITPVHVVKVVETLPLFPEA